MTTTQPPRRRASRATPRLTDDERAAIIADKMETRTRIESLSKSMNKLYRRLDYLTRLAPDE